VNNRKPFSENQVPCALRDFFSAFVSEKIKEEELYGHLLSNLLDSLEELHSLVCVDIDKLLSTIIIIPNRLECCL